MTPCSRHKGRCYGHCLYVCKLRASSASVDGSLLARVETGESFIIALSIYMTLLMEMSRTQGRANPLTCQL